MPSPSPRRRWRRDDENLGELNVVPYLDIVTNLVMFMLQVVTVAMTLGEVRVEAPTVGTGPTPEIPPITVVVGHGGYTVAGEHAVLLQPPGGSTVPRVEGALDGAALRATLQKARALTPTSRVVLVPEDNIPVSELVTTMDDVRGVFPDIAFGGI
ncbi:MAG: biopolymer transporter ExbD [Myxococcota bacterium]